MTTSALPKLHTRPEVAEIIHKSVAWLERAAWAQTGPPFRKIGNKPMYPEDGLIEWYESQPMGGQTNLKEGKT